MTCAGYDEWWKTSSSTSENGWYCSFDKAGYYTVKATVSSASGSTGSDEIIVRVR